MAACYRRTKNTEMSVFGQNNYNNKRDAYNRIPNESHTVKTMMTILFFRTRSVVLLAPLFHSPTNLVYVHIYIYHKIDFESSMTIARYCTILKCSPVPYWLYLGVVAKHMKRAYKTMLLTRQSSLLTPSVTVMFLNYFIKN